MSVEAFIEALPESMSKGQKALEALSAYRAARQPVPDEVLRQIDNCYRHFTEGKPIAFFTHPATKEPAPLTLGEAFGVPDLRGGAKVALKRKRLAIAEPHLVALFTGQGVGRLARDKGGVAAAASKLKLTVSEVENWVARNKSKTRSKKTAR